ncbi:MAG: efflux RND transporter permease subunit [Candidatus Omnitrophica bacterium]|nr:efflux RND transporter permease subunit [Candidatus Omnitrophota bacterium]
MKLAKFSIERPVTLLMIVSGTLILGAVSLAILPQELFPQITYPQLTVVTPYENAAPEEIETLITKPIEEAVGTVAGVKRIHSISKEGLSLVIAEFGWNQNINFAALGMREKIDLIKERLPREAEEPTVISYNPFDKPVLILSVTTSKADRTPVSLRELTRKMIKDEVEKVEGVASATISGGLEREIEVQINQDKLKARQIPILDVSKAISSANLNYPAGTIKESFYEYLIRTLGEFGKVSEIEDVAIGFQDRGATEEEQARYQREQQGGRAIAKDRRLIYVKDVAEVIDNVKERTSYSRFNGKENISIAVQKQALGNTVKIINRVKSRLVDLRSNIPKDVDIRIVYDQSAFIRSSITGVWDAAWQGGVIVFFVLLYFLRNTWSSVIVTLTIPISVMATFAIMFFSGVSINMMSLGGLAFGVGSLVDAAIVVIENIFRHMQMGDDNKKAAIIGSEEVTVSVAGSVLTTVVVFVPLIFVIGIVGQISKDFALTVTFSLLASWVASVTIIPLLASRGVSLGKDIAAEVSDDKAKLDKSALVSRVREFFERLLERFIKHKGRYIFYTVVIFLLSMGLFAVMDKELMPKVDQGQFTIKIEMPAGTRLETTNRMSEKMEKFLSSISEVESTSATVGSTKESATRNIVDRLNSNQAEVVVSLKKKRKLKSADVVQIVKNHFSSGELGEARIEYSLQENVLEAGLSAQAPITVEIKGNDLKELEKLAREVQGGLSRIKGVYGIKNDLSDPSPEVKIYIDKDKASLYGLSVTDIAQTSLLGLKGYISSKLKERGEEYDIRVRLRESDRRDFEKLGQMELQTPTGMRTNLSSVASFGKGRGPSEIKRVAQERSVLVYANVYERKITDVMQDVKVLIDNLHAPKNYIVRITGESEEMRASFDSMRNAIIAAFLLVYMVMAALFESLWQPFIIMFTIPLGLIGVSWALFITHTSVSAYVLMGVGILVGIVVNNAIVLMDCVNLFLKKGVPLEKAVVQASSVRFRPIMMTALATVLGLLPMAFLGGEGAELRSPMAITVMGGLMVGTVLTLVVIPTMYIGAAEFANKLFKKK